jgi:hypothetical protein
MKRFLFSCIAFFCVLFLTLSCGGQTFKDDSISLVLPASWSDGVINPQASFVMIETRPLNSVDTISTLISEYESQVSDASSQSKEWGVVISGMPKETEADIIHSIDGMSVTRRQIEIEENRLKGLISDKPEDQLQSLAEINVIENTYFMLGARDNGLSVSKGQVDLEIDYAIADIESSGTPLDVMLYGWGITREEFRDVVRQKLLYQSVLPVINAQYSELNEAEASVEFLQESMNIYPTEQIEGTAIEMKACLIRTDMCFIIIKGVVYQNNQENNVNGIIDSLASQRNCIQLGDIYIFSNEQ